MRTTTWTHHVGDLVASVDAPREVAPSIWWIPSCLTVRIEATEYHVHNSAYLVIGREKTLLYDTGHPAGWEGTEHYIEQLLGDRPLDVIVPSHPEAPHCGNMHRLLEKYPDSIIAGDVRDYHLMFPEHEDRLRDYPPGSSLDLGGEEFVFIRALLRDISSTMWGYTRSTGVLYTSDGFAFAHYPPVDDDDRPVHGPGECTMIASEFDRVPEDDQITWIVMAAFQWARYIDARTLRPAFDELLERYPTKLIAPAHGAVIDDMSFVPVIWKALGLAFDPTLKTPITVIHQSTGGKAPPPADTGGDWA